MSESAERLPGSGNVAATAVSGLVILPVCRDCKRRATPQLVMHEVAQGVAVCEDCLRRRHQVEQQRQAALPARKARPAKLARPPAPPRSLYAFLELPLDATQEELNAAVRAKMQYWTERQSGGDRDAAQQNLARSREARAAFRTDATRRAYDQQLREEVRAERAALATTRIRPLEDWPGRQVSSFKDLIAACESSVAGWQVGERLLTNQQLLFWARFALGDEDIVATIEAAMVENGEPAFRRLNHLLYQLDPDRPFRFFPRTDTFSLPSKDTSVATSDQLVAFADKHWDLFTQHLYQGELLVWLSAHAGYVNYRGQNYDSPQAFFDAVCRPFGGTAYAGVGTEALLEALDERLARPTLRFTIDGEESGLNLGPWDGELEHKPLTIKVENTTRGYIACKLRLTRREDDAVAPYPWLSFRSLPHMRAPQDQTPQRSALPAGAVEDVCVLTGKQTKTFTLYLGHLGSLPWGASYTEVVNVQRFLSSPRTPDTPTMQYPITLRLMRYHQGYRLKLWWSGLRGNLPGIALNAGMAFVLSALILWAGTALAPDAHWGLFAPTSDYASGAPWPGILDVGLTIALRPWFLMIAALGWYLPVIITVFAGLVGFSVGLGQRHRKYGRVEDVSAHRKAATILMLLLWLLAGAVLLANLSPESLGSLAENLAGVPSLLNSLIFFTGEPVVNGCGYALAVVLPGVAGYLLLRGVGALRGRLYDRAARRWNALLNPDGKA
ncbi:MAG TPA: hypothetical protein VFU60_20195 [Ktedonobacterales bacterium]|nr:hypothetical protein [Ktedonobacterales bacterium]